MSAFIVLQQMLVLFAMMAIGYILWKIHWLDEDSCKGISKLVVNVFNPLLLIASIVGYDFKSGEIFLGQNMAFVLIYFVVLFVAGYMITFLLRIKKPQRNFYQMMTMFSNIGFIGIPLVRALLGREYVIYIAFYTLVYNVLIYTYGIYLAIKTNELPGEQMVFPVRKILNPGVIGCVVAILIFVLDIPVAEPIVTFSNYMGDTCIPLSMILIGTSVAKMDGKKLFFNGKMYVFLAIKMLLLPIAAAIICKGLPVDAGVYKVFIIECSVPIGSMITLIAQEYGKKDDSAVIGVVLSTVLSVITIPIVAIFM